MKTPERMVHLALSQKAAKILYDATNPDDFEESEDAQRILDAIRRDLTDQIEQPKKKVKK